MAGFSVLAETLALVGIVGDGDPDVNNFISLHTGDPLEDGVTAASNEVVGGTYARVDTNWNPPAGGTVVGSQVTINVPSGTTITHWGLWSAVSSGNYIFGGELPAPESFGSDGTYSLTPTLSASDPA